MTASSLVTIYARCIVPMDVLSHFIVGLNYPIHIIPMNNSSVHTHTHTTCTHTHTHTHTHNSYLPVIEVHEMHGRMHPNYWQITILLVVGLCSSLAYSMMTHPLPIAGKMPIETLVAKQLPTNTRTHRHTRSCKYASL